MCVNFVALDKMQCGPSSIEAVRRGEVGFAFDTPFLYAEVNADVCHFQEDETSHWGFRKIKVNNYRLLSSNGLTIAQSNATLV